MNGPLAARRRSLLVHDGGCGLVLHVIHVQKPTLKGTYHVVLHLTGVRVLNVAPVKVCRRCVTRGVEGDRTGPGTVIRLGGEVEVRPRARVGVTVSAPAAGPLRSCRDRGRCRVGSFTVRRQVQDGGELTGGRLGELEELAEGLGNAAEGTDVGHVRVCESVSLADCLVKVGAPLPAESDRRQIVELRAGAAHLSLAKIGGQRVPI